MSYTYHQLSNVDAPRLLDLLKVFSTAFEDPETYAHRVPSTKYLVNFLSQEHTIVLVAMEDALVVGGLVAYELQKFEQERSEIYIFDLAVAPAHQRKGIATGLISSLKVIAKERGAFIMYVQADVEDIPAIRLYESVGKKSEVLHFTIPVN